MKNALNLWDTDFDLYFDFHPAGEDIIMTGTRIVNFEHIGKVLADFWFKWLYSLDWQNKMVKA